MFCRANYRKNPYPDVMPSELLHAIIYRCYDERFTAKFHIPIFRRAKYREIEYVGVPSSELLQKWCTDVLSSELPQNSISRCSVERTHENRSHTDVLSSDFPQNSIYRCSVGRITANKSYTDVLSSRLPRQIISRCSVERINYRNISYPDDRKKFICR